MDYFLSAGQWIKNQLLGKGPNQIHSPFVFSFFNAVLDHPYSFYAFEEIENQRLKLLENQNSLRFDTMGAIKKTVQTTVSRLAQSSLMSPRESKVIFRLANWLQANTIIELGVCLGITTSYLAKATNGKVFAWEAVPELGTLAIQNWEDLKVANIQLIKGKTEDTLLTFLKSHSPIVDLAVVDADHRYQATMAHFETFLPYLGNNSCLVFHDIYWSVEMAKAWKEICNRPEVTVSIDLFRMGIVFFRKESVKEHFIIRW